MSATVLQSAQDEGSGGGQPGAAVVTNIKKEAKTPPLYKVLLHNDDFTPMDFVIMILKRFFSKDENQATQIMLAVHNEGKAVCGVFTFEIAETKVGKVVKMAAEHQYPLKCTLEKE